MTEPEDMLPADDHPLAAAEGQMSTVDDDEYFAALGAVQLYDQDGNPVNHTEGVVDER